MGMLRGLCVLGASAVSCSLFGCGLSALGKGIFLSRNSRLRQDCMQADHSIRSPHESGFCV